MDSQGLFLIYLKKKKTFLEHANISTIVLKYV